MLPRSWWPRTWWYSLILPLVIWLVLTTGGLTGLLWLQQNSRAGVTQRFQLGSALMRDFVASYVSDLIERERVQAEAFLADPVVSRRDFDRSVAGFGYPGAVLLDSRGRALQVVPSDPAVVGQDLTVALCAFADLRTGGPARGFVGGAVGGAGTAGGGVRGAVRDAVRAAGVLRCRRGRRQPARQLSDRRVVATRRRGPAGRRRRRDRRHQPAARRRRTDAEQPRPAAGRGAARRRGPATTGPAASGGTTPRSRSRARRGGCPRPFPRRCCSPR